MARRRFRSTPTLSQLVDRELARVLAAAGLRPSVRRRRRRSSPPAAIAAAPVDAPPRFTPELAAYCARFPTVPAWLDPDAIVTTIDPESLPCMADAEDGEQPWHSAPFAFSGPPEAP